MHCFQIVTCRCEPKYWETTTRRETEREAVVILQESKHNEETMHLCYGERFSKKTQHRLDENSMQQERDRNMVSQLLTQIGELQDRVNFL